MSDPHRPQAAPPFLRRAAYTVIVLGCLLAAGAVLSSAMTTPSPPMPILRSADAMSGGESAVYALPAPDGRGEPLKALISFHHGSIQITNNSRYPWHDIQVQVEANRVREVHAARCARVVPYQTCAIPIGRGAFFPQNSQYCRPVFSLRWKCRTAVGGNRWYSYMMQ